jgi:SPP1 family predicted phage head-tail adaptor
MTGPLHERVTVERRADNPDASGGAAPAWATVASVWAKVEPLAETEQFVDASHRQVARYRLTIRRRTDVGPGMRAVWRGKALHLRSVRDAGPRDPYVMFDADDGETL